jgi:WhiB family redox-sensing transcriptional regulator
MARTAWRLEPISDVWDWQLQGRCRERGGIQFFHPDDDLGRISRRLRESAAKQLCQSCPVRKQCATHALKVGEEYGVWGGFSEHDRTLLRELGWQDAIDDDRLANLSTLDTRLARLRRQQKAAREERERQRAELTGAGAGRRAS